MVSFHNLEQELRWYDNEKQTTAENENKDKKVRAS